MGKAASSLVVYMKETIDVNKGIRMAKRTLRTTQYGWERQGRSNSISTRAFHVSRTIGSISFFWRGLGRLTDPPP